MLSATGSLRVEGRSFCSSSLPSCIATTSSMSLQDRPRQGKRYPASNLSISVKPYRDSHPPRVPSGVSSTAHHSSDSDLEYDDPPLRSPLLAHPKVRSKLRAVDVDVEADRLDRACGQSPLGSPTSSSYSYFAHPHALDSHVPDQRRASACMPRKLSPKRSHQSLRSSASEPVSLREQLLDVDNAATAPNSAAPTPPPFRPSDATEVLRALIKVLRPQGKQIRDYIEIEDLIEEKKREKMEKEGRLMETTNPPEGFRTWIPFAWSGLTETVSDSQVSLGHHSRMRSFTRLPLQYLVAISMNSRTSSSPA